MGLFDQFPYTNFHELNLEWLINLIKELENTVNNFVALNTIKYADPIQWDITTQYAANTVVIDPNTGTAYISTHAVPSGVTLTNTDYWTTIFTLDLLSANQNLTLNNDGTNIISTFDSETGDWLIWNNTLYKVIADIPTGTAYNIGTNIERFTVELFIKEYINNVITIIGDLDDLNTSDKSSIVNSINSLKSTLETLINTSITPISDKVDLLYQTDYVTPQMFGAKADGITDDTQAIQDAIDFAYDNKIGTVFFPEGVYRTTEPIILWCYATYGPYTLTSTPRVSLKGASSNSVKIAKDGTATSGVNDNDVDAIICIVNQNYKDDSSFSCNVESDIACACYGFEISNITLKDLSAAYNARVHAYGVFSNGWYFGRFNDVVVQNCNSGLYTQTYNCFTNYYDVDIQFALVGFDFDNTHIGGQTTMHFVNCHTNGCITYGYSLLGGAYLENCSNDGGTGVPIHAIRYSRQPAPILATVKIVSFHAESYYATHIVEAYSALIEMSKSNIEVPYVSDAVIYLRQDARATFDDVSFNIRTAHQVSLNDLYDCENSNIQFNHCKLAPSIFANTQIPYGNFKKKLFINGLSDGSVSYLAQGGNATCAIGDDITYSNDGTVNTDTLFIFFGKYDLTEIQTIRFFMEASLTQSNITLLIYDSVNSSGLPVSPTAKYIGFNIVGNTVNLNFNTYFDDIVRGDVSDITGEHYVALRIGTSTYSGTIKAALAE